MRGDCDWGDVEASCGAGPASTEAVAMSMDGWNMDT